jgi:hypothetical protein
MNSPEIELLYGLFGIACFIFQNPNRRHIYPISFLVLGLFVSQIAYVYLNELSGQIIWGISALGLSSCYFLRFKSKISKGFLEYLKILGVILLIIYPLPFYSLTHVGGGMFWIAIRMLTFSILGTIYFYDRWILNREAMKKRYVVVLVAQSVVILLMLSYAFVQKAEADRQREVAEQNERKANEMQKRYQELLDKTVIEKKAD